MSRGPPQAYSTFECWIETIQNSIEAILALQRLQEIVSPAI